MQVLRINSLFALVVVVIFFGLLYQKVINLLQNTPAVSIPRITPSPTPVRNDVHSSDGTVKLIMQEDKNKNGKTHLFSISDMVEKDKKQLFAKKTDLGGKMFVPFNSWSPDNKYLFIEEKNPDSQSVLLFKADGTPFSNNAQYIDVIPLFKEKNYFISEITGWDAPTLLHVHTKTVDENKKGPSFWFDIESKTFLQLAR